MFEDIAQMEKEIEEFRNNILASSELIKGITELTEATKQQRASFQASSEALVKQLDACITQFKINHNDALQALGSSNAVAMENLHQSITTDMKGWIAALESIKTAIESCEAAANQKTDEQVKRFSDESDRILSEMQSSLATQQASFLEKLNETENVIRGYQSEAEKKYNSFLQQLENTNANQIFREVQELKKSMQVKFAVLMAGVGAAVVAAILSIVIN